MWKLLFFFFLAVGYSIEFSLEPTLPAKLTQVNIATYDIYGSGVGATSFIIRLGNPDKERVKGLKIEYEYRYRLAGTSESRILFKGESNRFDIGPKDLKFEYTSTQFLKYQNPTTRFSHERDIIPLKEKELRDQVINRVIETGSLISGELVISAKLINPLNEEVGRSQIASEIINISRLNLVYPQANGVVYTATPQFLWTSDLYDEIYGEGVVFEFLLYEQKQGMSKSQALLNPIMKQETTVSHFNYPISAVKLNENSQYYWKINGILRGGGTSQISSEIIAFRYENPIEPEDPEVRILLEQLRSVLYRSEFAEFFNELEGYLHHIEARVENRTISKNELKEFLGKFNTGELKIEKADLR